MSSPYSQAPQSAPSQGGLGLAGILALVTGGLGMIVYFLSFSEDAGAYTGSTLSGVLLLGGGLLAASTVLPRASRSMIPATVLVAVGTLFLLIAVAKDPFYGGAFGEDFDTPGLAVVVLVIAFFELAACVGALLAEQGLIGRGATRSAAPQQGWGPQSGSFPGQGHGPGGQQGLGQQGPGSYPGQHAAPSSGAFPAQPQPTFGSQQPTQSVQQFGGQYGGPPGEYGQQQPGQYGPGQYGPGQG